MGVTDPGFWQQLLRDWVADDSAFVLMNSPPEAHGSNDCAVFMLAACAHWVLREGNNLPSSFELRDGISAQQFGREWRRHVRDSIANGSINHNDPCLSWMRLPNESQ